MAKKSKAAPAAKGSLTSDQMMTAILSYLSILVLIPLFAVKERDEFIRFHLRQGLVLFIADIILWVVSSVLAFTLFFLFGLWWVFNIIWVALLIIRIIAIIRAIQGEMWIIPILGEYGKSIKV